jgi:hypothetical protein
MKYSTKIIIIIIIIIHYLIEYCFLVRLPKTSSHGFWSPTRRDQND